MRHIAAIVRLHVCPGRLVLKVNVPVLKAVMTAMAMPRTAVSLNQNVPARPGKLEIVGAVNLKTASRGFARTVRKFVMIRVVFGGLVKVGFILRP
jgi:hypothetical protein